MNPDPIPIDPWLTPKEVCQIHRIHPVYLCKMRAKRIGPAFRQLDPGGPVHYRQSVMEAWIATKTVTTAA